MTVAALAPLSDFPALSVDFQRLSGGLFHAIVTTGPAPDDVVIFESLDDIIVMNAIERHIQALPAPEVH